MNTETGEVRRMSAEEVARLNSAAGKELWKPLYEQGEFGSNREQRRKAAKKPRK